MSLPARLALAFFLLLPVATVARAQDFQVVDSAPRADATVGKRSTGFYVRFDHPVDHRASRLFVTRHGVRLETLEPRLEAEPNVLFARAPTLEEGQYVLHWTVRSPDGLKTGSGEIPFAVGP